MERRVRLQVMVTLYEDGGLAVAGCPDGGRTLALLQAARQAVESGILRGAVQGPGQIARATVLPAGGLPAGRG